MSKKLLSICTLSLWLLLGAAGCKKKAQTSPTGAQSKPYVVATTGMIADIVRNVGAQYVRVEGLMGPSVDPHLYKATASDTHKLTQAKLVLYNGLHLEGKMQDVLQKMARFRPVIAISERIQHSQLLKPKGLKGFHDPHIWFDASLWRQAVQRVQNALIQIDPTHKAQYMRNAKRYSARLKRLHAWVKQSIQSIPKGQRYLVTSHDAFGYFGRAYGLTVVGLQGISTVAEAGVKDVERVIQLLVDKKIPAIFSETSVSDKMIRAVIQGCTARKHTVKIGGSLYSDAMGKGGTVEGTYIGMVQANVHKIVRALSGKKVPAFETTQKIKPRTVQSKTPSIRKAPSKAPSKGR